MKIFFFHPHTYEQFVEIHTHEQVHIITPMSSMVNLLKINRVQKTFKNNSFFS